MSSFRTLQARHEGLINQAQAGQDIVDEVRTFIDEVKASSGQIGASSERDQLRSNLRYWASYLYEHTQTYPNVDLAPSNVRQQSNWIIPAAIGILALAAIAYITSSLLNPNPTSVDPTTGPALTDSPIQLPAATSTLPPAATTTLAAIAPTQGNAISIQLTSVQNGDQVSPVTQLSGTYSNLPAGYSIHVIIQPQSQGGVQFPMPQYALVNATSPSGEWAIEGRFGQGEELMKRESYSISLVAADESARDELSALVETGFQELPAGVIPFPQSISVNRGAISAVIDGPRLIYSSYLDEEGNFEIFSSNLDGSDLRRITNNSAFSELYPSLSPDGMKIAYVGRRRDAENRPVYSVGILNSDGTSPATIVEPQEGVLYERPLWSSDGDFIAYVTGKVSSDNRTSWSIWVYDLALAESKLLIEGNTTGPRYIAWIPGSHELIFDARMPATGTSGFRKIDISIPGDPSTYFDEEGEELQPAVSPDGSLLAYMQLDGTIGNIYVADLATGSVESLTNNQWTGSAPVWAPDGTTIFYQFFGDGFYNIWSVTMDGGPVQVTFGKDQYPYAGHMYALIP